MNRAVTATASSLSDSLTLSESSASKNGLYRGCRT